MSDGKQSSKAWWRPLVDAVDSQVTPRANALVRTNVFADLVAIGTRLEARLRRRMEAQTTWVLHQYNLPTATDVRRMRAQLAAVEARLRDMSERLDDQALDAERATQRPARKRTAAKSTAAKST